VAASCCERWDIVLKRDLSHQLFAMWPREKCAFSSNIRGRHFFYRFGQVPPFTREEGMLDKVNNAEKKREKRRASGRLSELNRNRNIPCGFCFLWLTLYVARPDRSAQFGVGNHSHSVSVETHALPTEEWQLQIATKHAIFSA
jgi:hypothetical protein